METLMQHKPDYFERLANGPQFEDGEEMRYEMARLTTFTEWPSWARVRPLELAAAGFYYTGDSDRVTCFSCQSQLGHWQLDQKPAEEHRRRYPQCTSAQGSDTSNVPLVEYFPAANGEQSDGQEAGSSERGNDISITLHHLFEVVPDLEQIEERMNNDNNFRGKSFSERMDYLTSGITEISAPHNHQSPERQENNRRNRQSSSVLPPDLLPAAPNPAVDETRVNQERYRLTTFAGWPEDAFLGPQELAQNGFYYLGNLDRVKCAFCNGVLRNWRPGDDVREEHRRNFRYCPFVRGMDVNNVALQEEIAGMQGPADTTIEDNPSLFGVLTCQPEHREYAIEAARLTTFAHSPKKMTVPHKLLAQAGFFYIGYVDSCKCFFCGGGLRNWETTDDPWSEHARWFPQCGFLRMSKGDEFIKEIQDRYGNGEQSTTRVHSPTVAGQSVDVPAVSSLFDPRSVQARMDTPTVQAAIRMGHSEEVIRTVIERRLKTEGSDFPNSESLIQAVFLAQDELRQQLISSRGDEEAEVPAAEAAGKPEEPTEEVSQDPELVMEENERMKEERLCKICLDAEANVVFLPCGHLVCCGSCAPALRICPICRLRIRGTVRVFLS